MIYNSHSIRVNMYIYIYIYIYLGVIDKQYCFYNYTVIA